MPKTTPRSIIGQTAQASLPKVNVSRSINSGKRSPSVAKVKTQLDLKKPSVNPKPRVPSLFKPLGGGTGEENPQTTPRNSPRGVRQRVNIKNPMSAL